MLLAKFISEKEIYLLDCPIQLGSKITELRNAGFLDFIGSDQPQVEIGKCAISHYDLKEGKVYQSWSIIEDAAYYQALVAEKKASLDASDYKIIKCYEATLAGEPLPYDFEALRTERQALRDEINRLENFIQSINL